jgi:hypothetical protein
MGRAFFALMGVVCMGIFVLWLVLAFGQFDVTLPW